MEASEAAAPPLYLVQRVGFCVEVLARIPIWYGRMWLYVVGVALKAVSLYLEDSEFASYMPLGNGTVTIPKSLLLAILKLTDLVIDAIDVFQW